MVAVCLGFEPEPQHNACHGPCLAHSALGAAPPPTGVAGLFCCSLRWDLHVSDFEAPRLVEGPWGLCIWGHRPAHTH